MFGLRWSDGTGAKPYGSLELSGKGTEMGLLQTPPPAAAVLANRRHFELTMGTCTSSRRAAELRRSRNRFLDPEIPDRREPTYLRWEIHLQESPATKLVISIP